MTISFVVILHKTTDSYAKGLIQIQQLFYHDSNSSHSIFWCQDPVKVHVDQSVNGATL